MKPMVHRFAHIDAAIVGSPDAVAIVQNLISAARLLADARVSTLDLDAVEWSDMMDRGHTELAKALRALDACPTSARKP